MKKILLCLIITLLPLYVFTQSRIEVEIMNALGELQHFVARIQTDAVFAKDSLGAEVSSYAYRDGGEKVTKFNWGFESQEESRLYMSVHLAPGNEWCVLFEHKTWLIYVFPDAISGYIKVDSEKRDTPDCIYVAEESVWQGNYVGFFQNQIADIPKYLNEITQKK